MLAWRVFDKLTGVMLACVWQVDGCRAGCAFPGKQDFEKALLVQVNHSVNVVLCVDWQAVYDVIEEYVFHL